MYEVIAILNPNVTNEVVEQKISDWKGIVTEYNAELHRIDRWGKKNLAYEVKKFHQGYFLLFHIQGEHAVIDELERRFRIADDVIRYQSVKLNEVEYKASVELLDQMNSRMNEEKETVRETRQTEEAPVETSEEVEAVEEVVEETEAVVEETAVEEPPKEEDADQEEKETD